MVESTVEKPSLPSGAAASSQPVVKVKVEKRDEEDLPSGAVASSQQSVEEDLEAIRSAEETAKVVAANTASPAEAEDLTGFMESLGHDGRTYIMGHPPISGRKG